MQYQQLIGTSPKEGGPNPGVYQLALIYFNNRKQREQQRRKLSSICGAYLIVYYLDFKKSD